MRSLFAELNGTVFDGKLPAPVFNFGETRTRTALGQCELRRWSWSEPFHITVDVNVDEVQLDAVVRHEIAHVAQWALGGQAGADEAAHGPIFRDMLARIDRATGYRWVGVLAGVVGEPTGKPSDGSRTGTAPRVEHRVLLEPPAVSQRDREVLAHRQAVLRDAATGGDPFFNAFVDRLTQAIRDGEEVPPSLVRLADEALA